MITDQLPVHVGNKTGKRDSTESYGVHFNLFDVNRLWYVVVIAVVVVVVVATAVTFIV